MDEQQREAFAKAVERKNAEAEERSHASPRSGGDEAAKSQGIADAASKIESDAGVQDDFSERDKSTGKGKVTADKWNQ